LNDGTSGLYEIKRRGGVAVVQAPAEAQEPSMPQSAMDNVSVDYCLTLSEIASLLVRLTSPQPAMDDDSPHGVRAMPEQDRPLSHPIAQTCPECGGAMREERQANLTRFRCHIGHIMTAEVMAAVQLEVLEKDLAVVLRTLNERVDLCRHLAEKHAARGDAATRDAWGQAGDEAGRRERTVRDLVEADWTDPEIIEEEDLRAFSDEAAAT
jgi:two-component system chemotaxis response regulator CheB